MTELLKTLYWNLYTPYVNEEATQKLDDCHKQLIDVLGKPEWKLVLRIIDGKDRLADEIGLDSFIFGFKLATQLAHELKSKTDTFTANKTLVKMSVVQFYLNLRRMNDHEKERLCPGHPVRSHAVQRSYCRGRGHHSRTNLAEDLCGRRAGAYDNIAEPYNWPTKQSQGFWRMKPF